MRTRVRYRRRVHEYVRKSTGHSKRSQVQPEEYGSHRRAINMNRIIKTLKGVISVNGGAGGHTEGPQVI